MSEVALRIRQVFEQLAADTPLSATDRAVMHAFGRLMYGQARVTDGAVTVVNICAEAGVSRATYYRSPLAGCIAGILRAPETPSPPLDALRAEIAELKRAERRLRSQHAVQVRELAGQRRLRQPDPGTDPGQCPAGRAEPRAARSGTACGERKSHRLLRTAPTAKSRSY